MKDRLDGKIAIDPIQLMRDRADALAVRSAGLKKLADAWQPLYQSLTDEQKQRLRAVAQRLGQQLKEAFDSRLREAFDESDDEDDD